MAKCKSCAKKSGMHGIKKSRKMSVPYTEIATAIVAGYAAGYLDKMVKFEADGTPKTGYLAENPTIKNALGVAAGVALTAYMKDEASTGAGIGLAVYFGYQLIEGLMTPATVAGLAYSTPTFINGNMDIPGHNIPGNYGYAQPNMYGIEEEMRQAKMYDDIVNNNIKVAGMNDNRIKVV